VGVGAAILFAGTGCVRNKDMKSGAAAPAAEACVPEQTPPPYQPPFANPAELCAKADRGQPWSDALPPLGPNFVQREDAYATKVQDFLRSYAYRTAPMRWLGDARWRLTGEFEGCPEDGVNRGPHPMVRIYYSPEVIEWMCTYRKGENELPKAEELPDGAMIIKEMIAPSKVALRRTPGTNKLWIAPKPDASPTWYDDNFDGWTVMIKASKASADGWYYGFFTREPGDGNPPLFDRSAFATSDYPGSGEAAVTAPPSDDWYPTYWQYGKPDVVFANYGFGGYCMYCHASAQGENTFSSFGNILGEEIQYSWSPKPTTPHDHEDHARATTSTGAAAGRDPFPTPLERPIAGFTETFPQIKPSYEAVWATRLPAQTYDHADSMVGVEGGPEERSTFLTSDQCLGCHEAGGSGQLDPPYMVAEKDGAQYDLSPWAEWSVSPMGLAGRDPIFHSQLELERNIARKQPGLAKIKDCIDNTCLHCHGASGARQYNIDTRGEGPKGDPCKDFLPPGAERQSSNYDGALFTQDKVFAWRDEQPSLARYGGLARDGINCTICHRLADRDLGPEDLKKTFTGNYRVGPADTLYGPFPNEASPEAVLERPMQNALAMTPKHGAQVMGSAMCGTCHTIYLPVFDDRGKVAGAAYEQTTYLEWLLSDFAQTGQEQSCQDCHMGGAFDGTPLKTGIANVQNTRYPEADFLLAAAEVDNPERPYRRHQLYGLNAFLNAYFQQFPLLLGYRQQDYMNSFVRAPLLTGRDTVLQVARKETADVSIESQKWAEGALEVAVKVTNRSGHNLPSGVGFRRLFIEVIVSDEQGQPLWASGRTNEVGVLLDGLSDRPLPTEFDKAGADGLPFQPHHQVITRPDQVQVYEEVVQNQSLEITSSFIHRYWEIKDNRLRARGYKQDWPWVPKGLQAEYGEATRPGHGPSRHWWPKPKPRRYRNSKYPQIAKYQDTRGDPDYDGEGKATGLSGSDGLTYRISLGEAVRARAKKVTVTLYSQSFTPSFLSERFAQAADKGAEHAAADRLYYLTGHLNTAAPDADGEPYLSGYRLRVASPAEGPVPALP